MRTVLQSHHQWGVRAGTVIIPSPVVADHLTTDETKAENAWEVRDVSDFMRISFRMEDSTKHVLGDIQSPKWPGDRSGLVLNKKGNSQP
jgi:hypothetical protein